MIVFQKMFRRASWISTTTLSPAQIKREVWSRDQGRCTYPGCCSKHFLEYDHIQPVSLNGTSTLENLRLLCRAHNQLVAIRQLGFRHMDRFIN